MVLNNPKITVLLSVFNDEKYISEAIESILNQTFEDFELLIIDDCSTDGTIEVINSYKDSRIRLIINEKNIDITKSLNKGLKSARGKYIARHDSDDVSTPERLEKQFNFLENNKDYAAVGSYTETIDEDSNLIRLLRCETSAEEIYYNLSYRNNLTSSSIMFVKEIIHDIGSYDESSSNSEDHEFWFRISRKYKIYVIAEYLIKYRIRDNQRLSKNYIATVDRSFEIALKTKINKKLLEFLQNRREEKPFFERIKLIKELNRFHINIQKEGRKINLNKARLKLVCYKRMIIFIIKIIIGEKGKHFIKRVLK